MPAQGEDASGSSAPTPTVILAQPRDPGTFSGTDNTDVEDWLQLYERVSTSNHWNQTAMLANLIFYLAGTARVWFQTHEEELTTWDICKQKLTDLFGKPVGRQRAAQKDLASRAQTCTESYLTYIQDVLALCRKVDPRMSEADKVAHVIKGIADDAFHLLVFKNSSTVQAIITECRRFEEAKSRRIAHPFPRLPNTAATSTCEDLRSLPTPNRSDDIVHIIRREIEAASPIPTPTLGSDNCQSTVSLIQTVVRQELANAGLTNVCSINRPDYASSTSVMRPRNVNTPPRYRNPAEWRTPDDKPICFTCGRIGHISRHCRSSWNSTPWPYLPSDRPPHAASRFPPRMQPATPGDTSRPARSSRSPSPHRRFSRSPPSRRSPSPSSFRRTLSEN